jgi:hypothetical protein
MEPDATLAPFFIWSWRGAWCVIRAGVSGCPISFRSHGRPFVGHRNGFVSDPTIGAVAATRGWCVNQNMRTPSLTPISCGVMLCITYVQNPNRLGKRHARLWLRARQH